MVEADVSNIVYAAIPEKERFRISLIQEALEMEQNISESFLSKKEIENIINSLGAVNKCQHLKKREIFSFLLLTTHPPQKTKILWKFKC